MSRRAPSLLANLARRLVLVSLLAVASAAILLYVEFKGTDDRMRQRTLLSVASMIEHVARQPDGTIGGELPDGVRSMLAGTAVDFAIVDERNGVLTASAGRSEPLAPVSHHRQRDHFRLPATGSAPALYGLSRRVQSGDRPVWIQVASADEEMHVEAVIEAFVDRLAWIWGPFVVVLLLVNLWTIRRGLRPLRRASALAAAIGPDSVSDRLPEAGMPREVLPLVRAVNLALSRLEEGYRAQRAFIADAAHELRTPLAVLEAHLGLMDGAGAELRQDVAALRRLVEQLLDLARLDALEPSFATEVDLHAVALDVATLMAPLALQRGRQIELTGAEGPVLVRGARDPLFRALRNLVENALAHTPPGTIVSIAVGNDATIRVSDRGPGVPPDLRSRIFERFRQGRSTTGTGDGAGLGLSIAAKTMERHGGTVEVDDRPEGGAVFTLRFPQPDRPANARL